MGVGVGVGVRGRVSSETLCTSRVHAHAHADTWIHAHACYMPGYIRCGYDPLPEYTGVNHRRRAKGHIHNVCNQACIRHGTGICMCMCMSMCQHGFTYYGDLVHEADAHYARGRELKRAEARRAEQPAAAAGVGAAAAHLLAHHDIAHVLAPHGRVVLLDARRRNAEVVGRERQGAVLLGLDGVRGGREVEQFLPLGDGCLERLGVPATICVRGCNRT